MHIFCTFSTWQECPRTYNSDMLLMPMKWPLTLRNNNYLWLISDFATDHVLCLGQVWSLAYLILTSFLSFWPKGGMFVGVRLLLLNFIFNSVSFSIIFFIYFIFWFVFYWVFFFLIVSTVSYLRKWTKNKKKNFLRGIRQNWLFFLSIFNPSGLEIKLENSLG